MATSGFKGPFEGRPALHRQVGRHQGTQEVTNLNVKAARFLCIVSRWFTREMLYVLAQLSSVVSDLLELSFVLYIALTYLEASHVAFASASGCTRP